MEKKNKKSILIGITVLFLVTLILLGLTYAYYRTRIVGNENPKSISVTSKDLKLVYNDGSDGVIGGIGLAPSSTVYTKTFTVKNQSTSTTPITYDVYLINVINELSRKEDVQYKLSCSSTGAACNGVDSETTFPKGNASLVKNTVEKGVTHTYTFSFTYKDAGIDQSEDMGKELSAKLQIFGETDGVVLPYEEKTLAYHVVNNAFINANGTTLGDTETTVGETISGFVYEKPTYTTFQTIANDVAGKYFTYASDYEINESSDPNVYETYSLIEPKVVQYSDSVLEELKGKYIVSPQGSTNSTMEEYTNVDYIYQISTDDVTSTSFNYLKVHAYSSTEEVLSTAEDDFGTSYFYRGGVVDNYVNFADMCWKVVRIEGDGSVKLILEDATSTCQTAVGNWSIGSASFGYSARGAASSINNYLNLDGTAISPETSMASKFKDFQNTFTSNELSKLRSGNWCLEEDYYSSLSANIGTTSPLSVYVKESAYTSGSTIYSEAFVRLQGNNAPQVTLKCNGRVMDKFSDGTTDMYVGTLTADEVVYAGGKPFRGNAVFYLISDYMRGKEIWWWTLTPSQYFGAEDYDGAYIVGHGGNLSANNDVKVSTSNHNGPAGLRPAVSLKAGVKVTKGDGTKSNPYVIG